MIVKKLKGETNFLHEIATGQFVDPGVAMDKPGESDIAVQLKAEEELVLRFKNILQLHYAVVLGHFENPQHQPRLLDLLSRLLGLVYYF